MALDFITAGIELVNKVIDKFPDPAQKAAAQLEVARLQQTGELAQLAAETDLSKGQIEINKIEAASSRLFISGWRPWIGWVCGVAFAYHFVLQPFLAFLMTSIGHPVNLPSFDMDALSTVLIGMLGLGSLRTVEKVKGVKK